MRTVCYIIFWVSHTCVSSLSHDSRDSLAKDKSKKISRGSLLEAANSSHCCIYIFFFFSKSINIFYTNKSARGRAQCYSRSRKPAAIESRRKRHIYIRTVIAAWRGMICRTAAGASAEKGHRGTLARRRGKAGRTRDERDARDHSPVNCLPPRRVPSPAMLLLRSLLPLFLFFFFFSVLLSASSTVAHRQYHRLAHVVAPSLPKHPRRSSI